MSESEETQSHVKAVSGEPIDLRKELKRSVVEEFKSALLSATTLTEAQRSALSEAVDSTEVSAPSLLKILSAEG